MLAIVIALAHDLGHPPFGHSGEITLNRLLLQNFENGFDHDRQTLRTLVFLEHIRDEWKGLNLCQQILMDIRARGNREHMLNVYATEGYPQGYMSLEGQVVEFSDKLTFLIHDLEDMIRLGIVTLEELCQNKFFKSIISFIKVKLCDRDCKDENMFLARFKTDIYLYFLDSLYKIFIELAESLMKYREKSRQRIIFITESKLITCQPDIQEIFMDALGWMYENIYKAKMKDRDDLTDNAIAALFDLMYRKPKFRELFGRKIPQVENESLARHIADKIADADESYVESFIKHYMIP